MTFATISWVDEPYRHIACSTLTYFESRLDKMKLVVFHLYELLINDACHTFGEIWQEFEFWVCYAILFKEKSWRYLRRIEKIFSKNYFDARIFYGNSETFGGHKVHEKTWYARIILLLLPRAIKFSCKNFPKQPFPVLKNNFGREIDSPTLA